MNYFNVDFDTIASKDGLKNKKEFFSFRLSAKQFGLNPGPYVIYPGMTNRELICIPMYRFKELEEKFYKLSEKRNNSDHEKSVKQKNLKQYMSEQECDELSRLRGILTNSYLFMINSYSTVITLPYKYISILRIKEDYLKFISADSNEFLLVNSADAWRYAENKNYRYDVGRNKKSI